MVSTSIFPLYAWNAGPVDGTDIYQSVVSISRELPFRIVVSPAMSRESTSEGVQSLDNFEVAYPLLFRQIEMFNILVSEKRLIHRYMRNKGNITR